jgi:hypothetical protein
MLPWFVSMAMVILGTLERSRGRKQGLMMFMYSRMCTKHGTHLIVLLQPRTEFCFHLATTSSEKSEIKSEIK